MNKFSLRILATDKPFFEGECLSLVVPALAGQYGIQAGHCNYVTAIVPGELDLTYEKDGKEVRVRAAVSEGIVKVEQGNVLVLVDTVELPEEIDENRARRAAEAAREDLSHKQSIREYYAAQARLARAVNRLKIKKHRDGLQ